MKIKCQIKKSKTQQIIKQNDLEYLIYVTSEFKNNEANEEIIELIKDFFKVQKKQIKIIFGKKSKNKVIEVL